MVKAAGLRGEGRGRCCITGHKWGRAWTKLGKGGAAGRVDGQGAPGQRGARAGACGDRPPGGALTRTRHFAGRQKKPVPAVPGAGNWTGGTTLVPCGLPRVACRGGLSGARLRVRRIRMAVNWLSCRCEAPAQGSPFGPFGRFEGSVWLGAAFGAHGRNSAKSPGLEPPPWRPVGGGGGTPRRAKKKKCPPRLRRGVRPAP